MDFSLTEEQEQLRATIRSLIVEHVDDEVVAESHRTGGNHAPAFARALGEAGVLAQALPGAGRDPVAMWLLSSECEKLAAPFDSIGMSLVIGGVIDTLGTDWQKENILAGLLAGEELVCFGLTEPDGGSDLAAARTRARRDGDGWVVSGAKMWTTMAQLADWVFLFARTDAGAGRYGGFTTFVFGMDSPGVRIDPIWTVSTERSNATFYDDVRVGPEAVLGEPDQGWQVLATMLGFERGMANTGALTPLLRRFTHWARSSGRMGDPVIRDRMAQIALDAQVCDLLTQRTVWTAATGRPPGTEGSIAKVFATEAYQRHARWAQETAAPESLLGLGEPGAAADGWIDHDVRHAIPQTLQGGTSEINRNNIAERHLGLPRSR